ncbi:hypothetical protein ABK040_016407 [Willaertia magna]
MQSLFMKQQQQGRRLKQNQQHQCYHSSLLLSNNSSLNLPFEQPTECIFQLPNEQELHAHTAILSLNRPMQRNALSQQLVNELLNILSFIKNQHLQHSIRCLILKSNVKDTFCTGADLKERSKMSTLETSIFVNKLRFLMNEIENLPIPTIACLNGYCLGGGMEMALACDLRVGFLNKATIADDNADNCMTQNVVNKDSELLPKYFGLVETALGIIPGAGGCNRLPRLIGIPKAKELIYTAKKINVLEALEIGILNDVCIIDNHKTNNNTNNKVEGKEEEEEKMNEDKVFMNYVLEKFANPIVQNGPIAVKMAKQAIQQSIQLDVASGNKVEELCYAQVIPTKDRLEGLLAFKEKRKPNYKGE